MQLAYQLAKNSYLEGFLVLLDVEVTRARLDAEWQSISSILQKDILSRLTICIEMGNRLIGIPRDPDRNTQIVLAKLVAA